MAELSLQNCRIDGRYDIQTLLGRGSYAEIYVARDALAAPHAPHHLVVIKALNVFLQNDLDADLERTLVENFQNEAIALDRVRHPNIISRLGHGTAKDLRGTVFHYLVLEYLPGGDLARACQKNGLPLAQALNYLEQVCAGLAHAHSKGVIHRDIKPQNLLLTADRKTVKIADFGVARISQSDSPITRVGTNMYAPPEHSPVFNETENVAVVTRLTPAADIYSLAKSAYVLVTGESPRRFSGAPVSDLPVSFRYLNWAEEFLRVLRRATQNNPASRPQTVEEFWKDLMLVKVRAEAEDAETETQISTRPHLTPQPSVTKDFTPQAPVLPKFNTSRDLKYANGILQENSPHRVVKLDSEKRVKNTAPGLPSVPVKNVPVEVVSVKAAPKQNRVLLRRAMIFAILLTMFAGALFAMQNYFRTHRILPEIQNPFKKPEGVANTDVNLRSEGASDSQKIGIVPKGSRVRVVNSKDNWYEIDVTEFSRAKDNASDAEHGWVNKRYIDMQE